jgi:hypothetical protein
VIVWKVIALHNLPFLSIFLSLIACEEKQIQYFYHLLFEIVPMKHYRVFSIPSTSLFIKENAHMLN